MVLRLLVGLSVTVARSTERLPFRVDQFLGTRPYLGPSELTHFCNEADSLIAEGPDASAVSKGCLMKLLVVIVSYRVTDLTIDCLRSLSKAVKWVPDMKVVVCENGTGSGAADRLRQAIEENDWGSWVDLTVIYPNRGFTGGNNAVIGPALHSYDPPDYVLLLNADTIVQEHTLDSLVAFMDNHPKTGIAASLYFSPEGSYGLRRSDSQESRLSWTEDSGLVSSRSCWHRVFVFRQRYRKLARWSGSVRQAESSVGRC